jgi:CPA1 family monovalent cation:H+ antiporter
LVSVAAGNAGSPLTIVGTLSWSFAGGIAAGGAVAGLLLVLAGRTGDHLVEITLTTIAAYGSFLLAEHFAASGVLASLAAGLVIGNIGWRGAISEGGRGHMLAFWEYAAFLANSVVFILIGGHEGQQPLALFTRRAAIAILLVLVGRALAVYPLSALLMPTSLRVNTKHQHILFWGGLRGALALALALALPENIPERGQIIVVTFAVVAFSVFVQGLTMPWLIRWLGLTLKASDQELDISERQAPPDRSMISEAAEALTKPRSY